MKIGILVTGHAIPEVLQAQGDYDAIFAELLSGHGFSFDTYNVVDEEYPDRPQDADGWLITGSKHGAYENHPWIPPLEDFIRAVYADGRPLVGVCFGHQIIAQALGGKVEKFDGGWAVGRTEYDIAGETVALNAWHQDQIVELPKDAEVIGSNEFCTNAALVYGDKVYTIQPHPEFGADMINRLIHGRGKGVVPDEILSDASDRLNLTLDNAKIADRMAQFFKRGT